VLQLGVSAAGLALTTAGCTPAMPWNRPRIPRIAWGSYGPREGAITELYITPFLEGLRQNSPSRPSVFTCRPLPTTAAISRVRAS
jgi:hypothetical protein